MEEPEIINQSNPSIIENPQVIRKKSSLPLALIVLGVIELLFPLLMLNIVIQLGELYNQLEISPNPALRAFILIGLIILFSVIEVIYGFNLHRRQKVSELTLRQTRISQVLLVVGIIIFWLSMPLWIGTVMYPINNLLSQF